jgi:hypothetical protein
MQPYRKPAHVISARVLILSLFACCILMGTALAKKPPKTYPEEGKVIGTGVLEHQVGIYSHSYTVETDVNIFLLDCDKRGGVFHHTGEECGGDKKIQVGDIIHFRVEKEWFYIPVTETNPDSDSGQKEQGEERLRVLRLELKTGN